MKPNSKTNRQIVYKKARTAERIAELSAELDECEDDEARAKEILREMKKLQKG